MLTDYISKIIREMRKRYEAEIKALRDQIASLERQIAGR